MLGELSPHPSFHFLERKSSEGESIGFSNEEYEKLCQSIVDQESPDLTDEKQFSAVKFGVVVPFSKTQRVDQRTLFGVFEGAYSGHSFKNSAKGEISAESINQRKFHFIIYHSLSGRIYIGCQYLGNYGDYIGLKNTLISFFDERRNINAVSFRQDAIDFSKAVAKEVRVSLSDKGKTITSKNLFSEGSMVAVRKRRKDESFPEEVKKSLFPLLKSPIDKRRQAIASLLKDSLIDAKDDDIENCTVVASVNGRDRVIYVLGGYNFASRFHLNVPVMADGHPEYTKTKEAILKILSDEIVQKKEDA
jgi:hypothetical protein